MASIQKKGNKYYIVTRINGRLKWITGKRTKAETQKYMNEILYKIENKIVQPENVSMTVSDFLDNWFNTYCVTNLKLTTATGYRQHIDNYIVPRIGRIKISELKPIAIQNMYYDILNHGRIGSRKPLNPKTVIQTHRILRKALKNAVMMELISSNPCDSVELPRKKRFRYIVLEEREIPHFIKAFKETDLYLAVLMALSLGLRQGELLALQWNDIDFNKGTISITKALVESNREVKVSTPKTEKSNRVLLLPNNLLRILQAEKEERRAFDDDYIILTLKGTRYRPKSFARRYIDLRDRLELKKVRFHDLRHANASMLIANGVKPKVVQERLGHSNISTTLDIYTHLFKENQQEAVDVLDGIL
mgnify:CR=1 FL=1